MAGRKAKCRIWSGAWYNSAFPFARGEYVFHVCPFRKAVSSLRTDAARAAAIPRSTIRTVREPDERSPRHLCSRQTAADYGATIRVHTMAKIKAVRSSFAEPPITIEVQNIPEAARVVILIGPNGGGKSMILERIMQAGHGSTANVEIYSSTQIALGLHPFPPQLQPPPNVHSTMQTYAHVLPEIQKQVATRWMRFSRRSPLLPRLLPNPSPGWCLDLYVVDFVVRPA